MVINSLLRYFNNIESNRFVSQQVIETTKQVIERTLLQF